MSSDTVIRVENLGKRYLLDHQAARGGRSTYKRFSDVLVDAATAPFRLVAEKLKTKKLKSGNLISASQHSDISAFQHSSVSASSEEFWALRDVSFEVKRGEVVGIIGRNGAGKSTLLKILSRITEPTTGQIEIDGRVASLLEVGTGFHPELTGRENIFLNGAILGMKRTEIKMKFDEIVAFAEVEKFLDTPVKRYSSGMYVRLAFAVAAHMEPEILIVDEVLAVGDAEFQKKCLGKMQDVAGKEGRTVLFVSHNMAAIQRLCSRVVLLNAGRIAQIGATDQVVSLYLANAASIGSAVDLACLPEIRRRGNGMARFIRVELLASDGRAVQEIRQGEPMVVRLHITAKAPIDHVMFGFSFVAADGTEIMGTTAHDSGIPNHLDIGLHIFDCEIRPMILCPGRYYIRAAIFRQGEVFDHIDEMIGFDVLNIAFDLSITPANHLVGHVYLPFEWHNERTHQQSPRLHSG